MTLEWLDDVSPAGWIGPRLHPFGQDAGSVIPEGFEAYGRLFHPVEPAGPGQERWRWADLAIRNRRIVHPEMQFHWISRPRGERPTAHEYGRGDGPSWGSLPRAERRILVEHLGRHTATPDTCWFCVWDGFSSLYATAEEWRRLRPWPRVELPGRSYLLHRGPLDLAVADVVPDQSPNLWWPDDRAWCVATEVDYAWTYIGGSAQLLAAILADDRLEVLPARLTDKPFYDSDVLNAALEAP